MSTTLNEQLTTKAVVWNLRFLYATADDASLEADIAWCRQQAHALADAFAGRVADLEARELAALLQSLEALDEKLGRLGSFAFLNFITQTDNARASACSSRWRNWVRQLVAIPYFSGWNGTSSMQTVPQPYSKPRNWPRIATISKRCVALLRTN